MGAQRADVIWMILRQGMTLVAMGGAIGLVRAARIDAIEALRYE